MIQSENKYLSNDNPELSTGKAKILLVDDTPANLLVLEEVLANPAYHFIKAHSGKDALRFLLNDDFAVVLLDVQMPDMDGFETAAMMRENARTRNIPVIFITARSLTAEDIKKGYAQNAADYILKPFNPDILRTKVSVFVELYQKTHQLRQQTKLLTRIIEKEKEAKNALTQMAERLKRSNTELEQFAHVISHDLQEPLRMVASFVQLLAKRYKGKLDESADEYIHFAVDGANRMREMITSILHYSRINTTAVDYEWVDCDTVLDKVLADLDLMIKENRATLTRDPLPCVWADPTKLHQIFQNLITNAVKFKGDAPLSIHISTALPDQSPPPLEETADTARSEFKRFSIRDNGIGFEQQHAERIFQIFQRLHGQEKYPGTGIGLAICRRIIDQHGGRIWMESEPGKGTIAYFTLWELPCENKPGDISGYKEKS